jgi:transmembrane sensor
MRTDLPHDDLPWNDLARYFAGELPADEAADLERWIAADSQRAELVEELRHLWTATGELRQTWDAEAALRLIKQAPAGPGRIIRLPRFYHEEPTSGWGRATRVAVRVAAAVAIVAGGAWALRHRSVALPEPAVASSEVSTARGQRASLRLPDGTHVMLGPASTIDYAVTADHGPRAVSLKGDAYFEVTHVPDRPFTVETKHGVVRDLGTRFLVHAYPADSAVDVVVAEGKVSLAAPLATMAQHPRADSLVLAPGDLGRVTRDGRITTERGVAVERYLAWTEGRLEFRDTPMRDVVVQLGRWYDLEARLADSALGRRRLTASFKDESAPEVLRLIAASLGLRIEQQGNVVIIRGDR